MGCGSSTESTSNGPPSRIQKARAGVASAPVYNGVTERSVPLAGRQIPPSQDNRSPAIRMQNGGRAWTSAPGEPSNISRLPNNTSAFQREIAESSGPGVWPKVIQRPNMPFIVHIHSHLLPSPPLGNMPCWTYVSQGLSQVNQPEVVFTLLRRQNEQEENIPEAPVEWMRVVYGLAASSLNLETGQMCDLVFKSDGLIITLNEFILIQDHNKWTGMQRFGMLVHGVPLCISTLPRGVLDGHAHHVIALTHEEAAVARQFGPTRVIGHVGLSVRWFPYPPWVDRDRTDCVTMADQAGSIRIGLPMARMYGFNAMVVEDEVVFTIPEGETKRDTFRKYVSDAPLDAALAFDSFMSEDADSGLVWKTGQTKPMGYGSNSGSMTCMNLGFITFAPEQSKDHCVMVEDGYGILLRNATWKTIRDAVQNTRDIVVNLENDMRFRLVWEKTVYHNPIDGKEYKASSNPIVPDPLNSHVQMSEIIFLVEPPRGDVDVQETSAYVLQVVEVLKQLIPVRPIPMQEGGQAGRQMIVEIEMPKCEGWLKMSAYPSMEGLPSQQILPEIARIVQPRAMSRVKFQLLINLWGYQGPPAHFS